MEFGHGADSVAPRRLPIDTREGGIEGKAPRGRLARSALCPYTDAGRTALNRRLALLALITALAVPGAWLLARSRGEETGPPEPPSWLRVLPAPPAAISKPRALAAGAGRVWAFDDQGFVRIYDYDGAVLGETRLIQTLRGFPNGAMLEPEGSVLVADSHESRILRISPDGAKLESLGDGYGSAPGQFVYPQRLVRVAGRVYVTEFGYRPNCRVQVFTPAGRFLFAFGGWGTEGGTFTRPSGIAAAPDGTLFVADASHRIEVWSPEGEYLRSIGAEGRGPGQVSYPWGLASDGEYLYVAEYGNHRLSRFAFDGRFAGTFGGSDQFLNPRDVALADGFLFVADTGQDRIVRLDLDRIRWRTAP